VTRIGVILGSTRPNRNGAQVAAWVHDRASRRTDAEFDLVDLLDYPLPHLAEPVPAAYGGYVHAYTRAWSAKVATYDGFVLVTPEYNHSTSAVLKNALDHLYVEWNNKSVGLVSYGGTGGVRAAEHLRLVCGAMQLADVTQQVTVQMTTEFVDGYTRFRPSEASTASLDVLLDQVVAWASALAPLRTPLSERIPS
jgi:NAD(P)H-dependent FMN reductase